MLWKKRRFRCRSSVFAVVMFLMAMIPGAAYCSSVSVQVSLEENPSCTDTGFTANAQATYTAEGADQQELQAGGKKEYRWIWVFDGTVVKTTGWGSSSGDSLHHTAAAGDDYTLEVTVYARVSGSSAGPAHDTATAPPVLLLYFDITSVDAVPEPLTDYDQASVVIKGDAAPASYNGLVWCTSRPQEDYVSPESITGGCDGELNWQLVLGLYEADMGNLLGVHWTVDGAFSGEGGPCSDSGTCQLN